MQPSIIIGCKGIGLLDQDDRGTIGGEGYLLSAPIRTDGCFCELCLVCTGANIGAAHPSVCRRSHTIQCIVIKLYLCTYVPIVCILMYVLYICIQSLYVLYMCTYIPRGCLSSHVQFIHKCVYRIRFNFRGVKHSWFRGSIAIAIATLVQLRHKPRK